MHSCTFDVDLVYIQGFLCSQPCYDAWVALNINIMYQICYDVTLLIEPHYLIAFFVQKPLCKNPRPFIVSIIGGIIFPRSLFSQSTFEDVIDRFSDFY